MRADISVVLVAVSLGPALAQPSPATCTTEHAVYAAERGPEDKFKPDEMWFDYKHKAEWEPWPGFPGRVIIRSSELGDRHFTFETYMTNNSGKEGMNLQTPGKRRNRSSQALEIETLVYSVNQKLEVGGFPLKDQPAPELIIFPGFWDLAHSSYNGRVSTGMQRQIFRFSRCEKRSRA